MNGDDAILAALADSGFDACFATPGTSEMHFVFAPDREPPVRPVLYLFEGVAPGAADGQGRVARKPRSASRAEWPNKAQGFPCGTLQGKPSSALGGSPARARFGARVTE